ncbi:MAG: hypothetical protein JWP85_1377 [Rhodoglobus sp.]|nr:hypothetical protein [Rhodoglobus sp.]
MADYEVLEFASEAEWEQWLAAHHDSAAGIRIALAKKGSSLESVTQPQALDVALCYGWIDGIRHALDDKRYVQTYTPRRSRSLWSQVNRDKVAALIAAGRMQPAGQAEIDRAKADGRWDAAYAPVKNSEVPDDLAAAIAASPAAAEFFPTLTSQNRFALIFRTTTAKRAETRARRIAGFVEMLERGETIY